MFIHSKYTHGTGSVLIDDVTLVLFVVQGLCSMFEYQSFSTSIEMSLRQKYDSNPASTYSQSEYR